MCKQMYSCVQALARIRIIFSLRLINTFARAEMHVRIKLEIEVYQRRAVYYCSEYNSNLMINASTYRDDQSRLYL